MKAPLEHQVVDFESQGNQFFVCGVSESTPPLGLLKSAPFWHCREVKRLLSRVVFSSLFFSSRLVRGIHLGSAPSDRGSHGAPGTPHHWAWGVKIPRGTDAKTTQSHGAKGQVRNTIARLTVYGPHHNLHRTNTIRTQKTASGYLE